MSYWLAVWDTFFQNRSGSSTLPAKRRTLCYTRRDRTDPSAHRGYLFVFFVYDVRIFYVHTARRSLQAPLSKFGSRHAP